MGAHTIRQGMFMVEPKQYGGASVVEARKASKDYQRPKGTTQEASMKAEDVKSNEANMPK